MAACHHRNRARCSSHDHPGAFSRLADIEINFKTLAVFNLKIVALIASDDAPIVSSDKLMQSIKTNTGSKDSRLFFQIFTSDRSKF